MGRSSGMSTTRGSGATTASKAVTEGRAVLARGLLPALDPGLLPLRHFCQQQWQTGLFPNPLLSHHFRSVFDLPASLPPPSPSSIRQEKANKGNGDHVLQNACSGRGNNTISAFPEGANAGYDFPLRTRWRDRESAGHAAALRQRSAVCFLERLVGRRRILQQGEEQIAISVRQRLGGLLGEADLVFRDHLGQPYPGFKARGKN